MQSIIVTYEEVKRRVAAALPKLKRLIPSPNCFGAQSIKIDIPEHGLQGVLNCAGLQAEISIASDMGRRPGSLFQSWYYHEPEGCNGVPVERQVFASGAWDYGGMGDKLDFGLNDISKHLDWEAILLTLGKPSLLGQRLSQNRMMQVPFALWRDKCGHEFTAQLDTSFLNDPRIADVPRSLK
jgi:hypothetical protein